MTMLLRICDEASRPKHVDAGTCVRGRLRRRERGWYCAPSMILIGGQKCGSTSLANLLLRHPQIKGRTGGNAFTVSRFKHTFFARMFRRERISWTAYVRQPAFLLDEDDVYRHTITFEKSPDYMASSAAVSEIYEWMPGVKILAILRDPVRRAYSAFQWQCNKGRVVRVDGKVMIRNSMLPDVFSLKQPRTIECVPEMFDEYLRTAELRRFDKMDSIIGKGMYYELLKTWIERFPRSQLHVVLLEQLSENNTEVLSRVLEFAGLDGPWLDAFERNRGGLSAREKNVGRYSGGMSESSKRILRDVYAESNRKVKSLLGLDGIGKYWADAQ